MGVVLSYIDQNFAPRNSNGFSIDKIPNLEGKVAIVTGANTGIGKETVRALLLKDATVYLGSRDAAKGEAAIADLEKQTGKKAVLFQLDLSDLGAIKSAAEDFDKKEKSLHILINNAGIMMPPIAQLSKDGYDLQFGTNVLGHFYLTKLLTPTLLRTAEETGSVRVVNVSSFAHNMAGQILWDTVSDTPERKKTSPFKLYSSSKFAQIVYSYELARRYGDKGIVSIGVHPGTIASDLYRRWPSVLGSIARGAMFPIEKGALTQLYCATAEGAAKANGKYYIPWAREGEPNPGTKSEELGKKLWEWLEKQVEGK